MTDMETNLREEYHELWSNPERIHRSDKNQIFGWHFGYYEKGIHHYKKAYVNMNNYVGKLLEIKENSTFLDAGCGVGATVVHLAKKNPETNFYGITLSSNEVKLAEKLSEKYNLKNTNFSQKSYNSTDFPDDHFDAIYALESATYAKDDYVFLKEMNRILKKDSKLIVIDLFKNNDLMDPFMINIRKKIAKEKKYNRPRKTLNSFIKCLNEAGFKNIQINDLVKSKNVKKLNIHLFNYFYLAKSIRRDFQKEIREKNYSYLLLMPKFIYYFFFRSLIKFFVDTGYYSIVAVKK